MEQPVLDSNEDIMSDDCIRTTVCDATFTALRDHFLAQGKGRRPKLPPFDVPSNRVVAQLFYLKEIKSTNFEMMAEWYSKLFRSEVNVTSGRLRHHTEKIFKVCTKCTDTTSMRKFIDEPSSLALPGLDPCLTAIGLTRHILMSDLDFTLPPGLIVTNGIVLSLEEFRVCHKLPVAFTIKKLRLLLSSTSASKSDAQLSYYVTKIIQTVRKNGKTKGFQRHTEQYLAQPIFNGNVNAVAEKRGCSCHSEGKALIKELSNLKEKCSTLQTYVDDQSRIIAIVKEERDSLRATTWTIPALQDANHQLKNDNNQLLADRERNDLNRSRCYKANNIFRRQIDGLQQRLATTEAENEKMAAELKVLKSKVISEQKLKHKALKRHKKEEALNKSLQELVEMDVSDNDLVLKVPGKNRFQDFVRVCYMELQGEGNVAAINCSKVVDIVARNFFGQNIKESLPGKSSVIRFADEGHLLAKRHVMDAVCGSKHFTFSCDGTSRQKRHYLEQHITLDSGKVLSLGFLEVASDDSDTLLEACVSAFKDICRVGELEQDVSVDNSFKEVITKMKCLMSDRAAVMKAFDAKMAAFKSEVLEEDSSTHFLFCNAHFLIGLATEAENALKSVEAGVIEENGVRLGRDANPVFKRFLESDKSSSVSRVIRLSAEVCGPRGDEKNGCREEWLAYCTSIEQRSAFTSYRSNRFNCFFENATALLHHKDHLERFLNSFASHSNQKLQSILEDLRDDTIMSMISALSLLHVVLTAPYWNLMNSSTSYGQFPQYVQKMESCLSSWANDSTPPTEPIFPEFATSTAVPFVDDPFVLRSFREISAYCLVVLRRQLADFLEGGVFGGELSPEVQAVLNSCPLTNLTGERLFGDLDYEMGKRRRASIFLRSTLNMWKINKTSRWIRKQSAFRMRKLISRAIRHAPKWRALSRQQHEEVRRKVRSRIEANNRKKMEKDIQQAELKSATMDIILSQGGLCLTKSDLDRLLHGPKPMDNLKAQIRYRRLFRHEKILLSGKTKDLYHRLLQRL